MSNDISVLFTPDDRSFIGVKNEDNEIEAFIEFESTEWCGVPGSLSIVMIKKDGEHLTLFPMDTWMVGSQDGTPEFLQDLIGISGKLISNQQDRTIN